MWDCGLGWIQRSKESTSRDTEEREPRQEGKLRKGASREKERVGCSDNIIVDNFCYRVSKCASL